VHWRRGWSLLERPGVDNDTGEPLV
jgi:hypothetical protein